MRFRQTDLPVRRIARDLRVDAVIEGSVRRSGDQVRTTFQLVAADTERHLWAETYQTQLRDILTLQSQVAQAVAGEVHARLTPEERARFERVASVDPEAYQLYLRGRFLWNQATPSSLKQSIALFERAAAIDPSLTLAHVGLVEARGLIGEMEGVPPAEFLPDLEASARMALAADPDSGEAQASVGFAILYGAEGWDWRKAEASFERAIELAPGFANGHAWYAHLLSLLGRHDEAVRRARRASELDPLNPFLSMLVASRLYYARMFPEALEQTQRLQESHPDYWLRHWIRGLTLQELGRMDEAIDELQRAVERSEQSLECVPDLAAALALAGRTDEAHSILTQLHTEARGRYVSPWAFAVIHTGLGQTDVALDWLERAYAERDWRVAWIGPEPALDPLRDDPRYVALLRKLDLPTGSPAPSAQR
jgi:tetratricopeptide (TPR) repeat protein